MPAYFGNNLILLDKLAAGGMGEVFRARQIGTGGFQKTVAVKRILPQYAARPDFAEMFRNEMNLCAKLQHPNIVQVFSNGKEAGYLYLVMEFVSGRTVAELLMTARRRKIRIAPEVSCFIVAEVAQGLAYAHQLCREEDGSSLHIVHRDVSPQNIMLGKGGEVKILDFGIAKFADRVDGTRTGDLKGKIPYAAPEYIDGQDIDQRADLFGLGVVFHELLAQRPLFSADSTVKTLKNVMEMPIPSLIEDFPDVRFELEGIVMKALERDPNERIQTAAEFYHGVTVFANKVYPHFTRNEFTQFVNSLFASESDPAFTNLRELYGVAKKVPLALVQAQTEMVRSEEQSGPTSANSTLALSPKLLYIPIALLVIGAIIALFLFKRPPPQDISPKNTPGIIASLEPGFLEVKGKHFIEAWHDSSWLKNVARQTEPSSQPIVLRKELNGNDVLHFDGQDDYLISDSIASTLSRVSAVTFISVARANKSSQASTGARYLWSAQQIDRSHDVLKIGFHGSEQITFGIGREHTPLSLYSSKSVPIEAFAVYSVTLSDNRLQVFHNGVNVIDIETSENPSYRDIATFSIGQAFLDRSPQGFFNGDIAQLLIYSRALASDEQRNIERHLGRKFNLSAR